MRSEVKTESPLPEKEGESNLLPSQDGRGSRGWL